MPCSGFLGLLSAPVHLSWSCCSSERSQCFLYPFPMASPASWVLSGTWLLFGHVRKLL